MTAIDDSTIFPELPTQLGDFRVDRLLGEGGMGAVYEGVQLGLDRKVAIKVMKPDLARDEAFIERFRREFKAAGSFVHRNLIKVYKAGEEKGVLYFAMEFIDGAPVSDSLGRGRRIPIAEALRIVTAIAEALQAGQAQGIIHRDLKPENILLTRDGVPKLADLGLAKRLVSDIDVTGRGAMMGTPSYMAPEQARDAGNVDHRADIYSLGITLFHLATGQRPFSGQSPISIALAHAREELPDAAVYGIDLPVELDRLLRRMTAKAPEDRYPDYESLVADLQDVAKKTAGKLPSTAGGIVFRNDSPPVETSRTEYGTPTQAPTSDEVTVATSEGRIIAASSTTSSGVPVPAKRGLWVFLGCVWLLIAALLFLKFQRGESPRGSEVPPPEPVPSPDARVIVNDGMGPVVTLGITRPMAGQTNFPPLPMSDPPQSRQAPISSFEPDHLKLEKARHFAGAMSHAYAMILIHYDQIWRETTSAETKAIVEVEAGEMVRNWEREQDEAIAATAEKMNVLLRQGRPRQAYDVWYRFQPRMRTFRGDWKIYSIITNRIPVQYRREEAGYVEAPGRRGEGMRR